MRKVTSLLLRIIGFDRITLPDWWAYFGSFGDDFFGDEYVDAAS